MKIFFAFLFIITFECSAQSTLNPEITSAELKERINYLASDNLQGRFTGSAGADSAANFIKTLFESYGLKSFNGSYFQEFPFVASLELTKDNSLDIKLSGKKSSLQLKKEYIPCPFTGSASANGQIAFAGYGISAPNLNYDDYAGLDVKGKIVMVMRYNPDGGNPHSQFEKYSSYRYKAKTAKDKGAAGIIFVNGYNPKDDEDKLMQLVYDGAGGIDSLCAVQIKRSVADKIFGADNLDLKKTQHLIDSTKLPHSFLFNNANVSINTGIKEVIKYGKNVVGFLEGDNPSLRDQYLVIGAHYDHLGWGETGSLYRGTEPKIHYGADDNASGAAGILELAENFSSLKGKLKRSIIFISFSGEEIGALGSSYFVEHPPIPLSEMTVMINLDMIGRLDKENDLTVYGTGTSSIWKGLLNEINAKKAFNLKMNDEGYAPSDQSSFYAKKIPVLFFFTGTHTDYHRPSDTPDKINYPGEESILNFVFTIAQQLDTLSVKPDYINVPRKDSGKITAFRVYVGTVPDYSGQVDGLKINGVNEGSPAQKGGLQGGDIIIGFGGKKISNIYDYTYALGDYSPGDIVEVIVLRSGQKLNLKVELGAR